MPTSPDIFADDEALRHSALEDIYAIAIGCCLIELGIVFLRHDGLVTGGVAGIALLLSHFLPVRPGLLFTLINIPFFLLARAVLGTNFMVKTIIVSSAITLLSYGVPYVMELARIDPLFAALFGGTTIGLGILFLARHNAGVGGTGVMTLWLQKRYGWNAGRTQLAIDAVIMLASFAAVDPAHVLLSAISAAAISIVLIAFHRPGRYTGY